MKILIRLCTMNSLYLNMETWKDIENYEGYYQVSNLGNIRSLDRVITTKQGVKQLFKGKPKKQIIGKRGYYAVHFTKDCKGNTIVSHILIAKAFLPKIEGKAYVNHKDGNKLNNNIENLEWCTHKENINHAWNIGLCENTRKAAQRKLICVKTGKIYESIAEGAKASGYSFDHMKNMLNGFRKNKTTLKYA